MKKITKQSGFSLIELLVAIAVFSVIALMGTTAILVTINSNRTSQSISEVLSNFTLALESMSRNIRIGTYYHCGNYNGLSFPLNPTNSPAVDCDVQSGGADNISFLSQDNTKWFSYFLSPDDHAIHKATDGQDQGAITAPEITIDTARFFVIGAEGESTAAPNRTQPKVIIVISGKVDNGIKGLVPFNVQTTVSQRIVR